MSWFIGKLGAEPSAIQTLGFSELKRKVDNRNDYILEKLLALQRHRDSFWVNSIEMQLLDLT